MFVALVAVLPNPRAIVPGLTYYFRDFSLTYYPLRDFFAKEVWAGRWPFWNPYLHEGCAFFPMFYPLELIQPLWPGPAFVSWLLTLHLPIAALGMYALASDLGTTRRGAFAAGATFALSGLALSSLSLHWFLQALALAPLVALTLRRAILRGGRSIPLAALVLALSISTLAVEFVAQGALLGSVLGLAQAPRGRALARLALAAALGAGLAALPIALMLGIVGESLRGGGVPASLAMQSSLHPLVLLQLLLPDLYGSISEPLRAWWGGRLFDGGSPYFMSLYLGPAAIAIAGAGALGAPQPRRRVLLGLGLLGVWYALGSFGGLAPALAPLLRWFRFPVKAMLLPVMAIALLAGSGLDRLRRGEGWRCVGATAGGVLVLMALVLGAGTFYGSSLAAWLDISPRSQQAMERTLRLEGAQAALLGLALLGLAWAVTRQRLAPGRAAAVAAGLLVLDLCRAGIGINPQVPPSFFDPVSGLTEALDDPGGGRVFSYGVDASPQLRERLGGRGPGLERTSFLLSRQVLNPFNNVVDRVETAEGADRLSFIANPPTVEPWEYDPGMVATILPRLRSEAVSRVVSLDALSHPELGLHATVAAGVPGFKIRVYDVARPWSRAYVGCQALAAANRVEALRAALADGFDPARDVALEGPASAACHSGHVTRGSSVAGADAYEVESDGPGYLVTRDSFTPSWRATVDGRPAPVLRANGRHRAVPIAAGRHAVLLRYEPPGFRAGVAGSALAAAAAFVLLVLPVLQTRPGEDA